MKTPTFFEGVTVAVVAALAGGALHAALALLLPGTGVLRLVIGALALGYLVYLLSRSPEPVGRVTALAAWGLAAGTLWLLHPPLVIYVALHVGLIWLARSLHFHSGPLASLADLGLSLLGLAGATWAAVQSGSLALSLWCFFLVQALFVAIPRRPVARARAASTPEDRFERAHRAAGAAVRKLSSLS
jgi:hypothetical protein